MILVYIMLMALSKPTALMDISELRRSPSTRLTEVQYIKPCIVLLDGHGPEF